VLGTPGREGFDQDPEFLLRTPDALKERGRKLLTGTNGNELVVNNASAGMVCELRDVDVEISIVVGVEGGKRIWDCDIGAASGASRSSPNNVEPCCDDDDAVGVGSGCCAVALFGLYSGMTKRGVS
jgi:hypothetical protein